MTNLPRRLRNRRNIEEDYYTGSNSKAHGWQYMWTLWYYDHYGVTIKYYRLTLNQLISAYGSYDGDWGREISTEIPLSISSTINRWTGPSNLWKLCQSIFLTNMDSVMKSCIQAHKKTNTILENPINLGKPISLITEPKPSVTHACIYPWAIATPENITKIVVKISSSSCFTPLTKYSKELQFRRIWPRKKDLFSSFGKFNSSRQRWPWNPQNAPLRYFFWFQHWTYLWRIGLTWKLEFVSVEDKEIWSTLNKL